MSNNSVISELTERWLKSGLNDGDIFLLHSDTRRLLIEFFKKKKKN